MMRTFKYMTESQHWWSLNDYGAVVDIVAEVKPKRVLEFGPGWSTRALIEGGASHVDTCEDDPHWAAVHRERLVKAFPTIVTLHEYDWQQERLTIPAIDKAKFDLALIDGPRDTSRRGPALAYALARSRVVVLADQSTFLREQADLMERKKSHRIERRDTGPFAGTFVIMTRLARARSAA